MDSGLCLLVVGLELSDSEQVVTSRFEFLEMFISKTSSQVSLHKHVGVIEVECSVYNFGRELNFRLVLLIFAITESDIVENSRFKL